MRFNVTYTSGGPSLIVAINDAGAPEFITPDHPYYAKIGAAILAGEDPTPYLDGTYVPEAVQGPSIETLSDRVTIVDGVLHFDGDPMLNNLADTVLRYREEGRDPYNIVRFMERLSANPSEKSREALFTWAQAKDLTIDPNGFLIAYKAVTHDMLSISKGTARVDGVEHTGQIPYLIGTVVSMPRSAVNADDRVGCSTGLHVGSWDYASTFGPVLLEVRIDPANVVSVPSDCGWQKMRVCELEVIAVHNKDEGDDLTDYEPDAAEDEAMDDFLSYAPPTFRESVRNFFKRNKKGQA